MREGTFIKKNINRWTGYAEPTTDPDETARRFTHLVDDLAYAKTFYPFSNTVKYINGLAGSIYLTIFQHRRQSARSLITFWTTDLPLVIRRSHRIILFAFLFFLLFVALGAFSAAKDQDFIRAILGDGYVDMTERNIANGDPFNVYKDSGEFVMFLQIMWNNIRVAFNMFAGGIIFSVGTLYILFHNGVMVGAFESLFYQAGLGKEFILVVFIHGTLELSAIVLAGAAGLRMGNAILFPGTFTRLQSLKQGAKDGVKIMVSLVPVLIVAAFFESYLTRHTDMPLAASLTVLIGSAAFILFYYVWLPIQVARRHGIFHVQGSGVAE